ncbi:MAG: serine/threonine protein kinase [Candidatus Margulisbacteria bacterium]|nr:serine/threonine protein kinase [Candidatus Margulisiibacteriota bacterium]MBU1616498.1 serine/threonine protein kinase [Candidatus Margulisiibacteriota bacterium]MBU1867286.1 serine/threonine protein kinase [Candidatus Margulisiibacteriota bacterium]
MTTLPSLRSLVRNAEAKKAHIPAHHLVKPTLGKGVSLGKYTLEKIVGQGGYGQVWEGLDPSGKRYALKIDTLQLGLDINCTDNTEFNNFSQVMATGGHSSIINYFGREESSGLSFCVLEYLDRGDLSKIIKEHGGIEPSGLPHLLALNYLRQITSGLGYLHSIGLIHNDIKPENIMMDENGALKLIDLGVASSYPIGIHTGTPKYYSPEKAKMSEIDQRADIFALGITFFMMIFGRHPFAVSGDSEERILWNVMNERRPSLRIYSLPKETRQLMHGMLAPELGSRIKSCDDIIRMIDLAEKSMPKKESRWRRVLGKIFGVADRIMFGLYDLVDRVKDVIFRPTTL